MNENNIPTFYILDLDRTIFETGKSTELMEGVIALHDADLALSLTHKFEEAETLGESFSMRDFIVENIGEEEMQKIEPKYLAVAADHDLLMPGTKELIASIRAKQQYRFGILTYGSTLGQALKIKASKELDGIPFLITGETYKGALIASWRGDDDLYHLPEELGGFVVKEVVLIDDKPFSFKGLPIDCRGYLVKSIYDAGIEDIPLSVIVTNNLDEVNAAEKQLQ